MANVKVAFVVLMCMALLYAQNVVDAVTCGQVTSDIAPCVTYLLNGGFVTPQCCNGVRALINAAKTTVDRRAICYCLKSLASGYSGTDHNNAASLPGKCGFNIPYKISPSTNCASIN